MCLSVIIAGIVLPVDLYLLLSHLLSYRPVAGITWYYAAVFNTCLMSNKLSLTVKHLEFTAVDRSCISTKQVLPQREEHEDIKSR